MPLTREWTKIGRSLTADIRLDDPTVSRRHALICRQRDGVRVLDDRSLNGIFLNGERTEWAQLHDGDELMIGRYHMYFLETAGERDSSAAAPQPHATDRLRRESAANPPDCLQTGFLHRRAIRSKRSGRSARARAPT